ncbi:MAG: hypothetical protein QOJ64_1399 [Acidobacteriota bacterium]|jgi:hypothetical protein|nr:hypothetical protein [Acidobacteriota bacterium]
MPIQSGGNLTPFSLEVDPGPLDFMMAGCIAVLLEEDDTPNQAMIGGRIAYAKEMHKQLNILAKERIRTLNKKDITEAEVKAIKDSVGDSVKSAIKKGLSIGQKLFGNQDDQIGFTYVNLVDDEIKSRTLNFPEIFEGDDPKSSSNRYVLSGRIVVGPVPPPVVEICSKEREAVKAKEHQISGLQLRVISLQRQLQTATPQAKAGIRDEIAATNIEADQAIAELPALKTALSKCVSKTTTVNDPGVLVGPG